MPVTSLGGFEAVVFDAYGTLFDVASIESACAGVTADPAALARLWRLKQLEYATLRTIMDRYVDFWQITSDALDYATTALGIELDPLDRGAVMRGWLELAPFPEVPDALARLHLTGMRLAILSNGTASMLAAMLAKTGLRELFSDVLTSERVQVYKPDASIYVLATTRFQARPNELLFVTANGFDVAGGKAAGLTVCRVNRTGLPLDPLGFEPDIIVHDLAELAGLLTMDESGDT